uniref:uncharacterized protein LOC122585419 n=1 Tax=Erigeron canadensis TaxID=72917 RepID=UPI001CB8E037|nr:uncharacterized protein LOC122585419 [Erigeron canadensis]
MATTGSGNGSGPNFETGNQTPPINQTTQTNPEHVVNNNPPPPTPPTPSHVHVHYSNTPVPKFDGDNDKFTEDNNAARLVAEQDAINHAQSSKVASLTGQPCAALMSAENVQPHSMKEISSQMNNQTGPPAITYHKSDDSYKNKYKKLKAQIALLSLEKENEQNKCLVANVEEKWELSDESSDDEEEIRDDTESKLDIVESLNGDLLFVETVRTDGEMYLETVLNELKNLKTMANDFQSVQLALNESVALNEALELDNQKLQSDLEKEQMVIKTWVRASGRNYDACTKTISAQIRTIGAGDKEMAAAIPDIHELPESIRIKTPYDQPECSKKTESVETTPVEVKSGAQKAKVPGKKAAGEKPLPQKLEEQLQLLSRQVQSCTTKIKNLEGTSTPLVAKQNVIEKPLSKKNKKQIVQSGTKSEKKKGKTPVISKTFTPEIGKSPASASSSQPQKETGDRKKNTWYLDSTAGQTTTGCKSVLEEFTVQDGPAVTFGNDGSGKTGGYGIINNGQIEFTKVAFVNGLKDNLISVSQLYDDGYKVLFDIAQGTIFNKDWKVVMVAPRKGNVYVMDMETAPQEQCFYTKADEDTN